MKTFNSDFELQIKMQITHSLRWGR